MLFDQRAYNQRIISCLAFAVMLLLLSLSSFDTLQDTRERAHSFDMETCEFLEADVDAADEDALDCCDVTGNPGIQVRVPATILGVSVLTMRISAAKISDAQRLGWVRRPNPEANCGRLAWAAYMLYGVCSYEYAPFFLSGGGASSSSRRIPEICLFSRQIIRIWKFRALSLQS